MSANLSAAELRAEVVKPRRCAASSRVKPAVSRAHRSTRGLICCPLASSAVVGMPLWSLTDILYRYRAEFIPRRHSFRDAILSETPFFPTLSLAGLRERHSAP